MVARISPQLPLTPPPPVHSTHPTVPSWLGWLQTLSLVNYSFSALMIQQIHILPKPLAALVMQFVQLNPDDMKWNIAMLWIMNFGFQILTYINLSLRLRFATAN